ncbi:putative interferon-induced GTP-binding protein Mx2 [Rosellinia necatrix]|uniref:Putative interferon-induced GTP-binding protein Mx2 n=1 Tax=Rosellinia necatrix TaxID=77044 RepID=A0A1S7UHI5_ROSNE|nr:putative interferon-induced GTP-binding protein Mx2 [Rosellinia necatrix]
MAEKARDNRPGHGNLSILTKVDKLRELIGTRVALPQLVVVGDQSSGKSSVLENLTGFAFPRDAELCTRYATQITCRREVEESISVSIMVNPEASSESRARVKDFHRTFTELSPANLTQLFKDANDAMGISSGISTTGPNGFPLPAFSEHILKIEKLGPNEEHFTVIDVPGIFRTETEGVTTESDIELVMGMVKKYMQDSRTIILAIIPSNVDPATQEILKLAKRVDPTMTRTMAVLTKPDLAIERTTQQIAIDHVLGKRGDLTLGYYVVKNRGPDEADKTLEQGQVDELVFFSKPPWSALVHTGRAGILCLKQRVRDLLIDLIKQEFPKLKNEVMKELSIVRTQHAEMGASRNDQHTQRAYLNRISEAFQSRVRDGCNAYYTRDQIFSSRHDLRLITRVVEASESYSNRMSTNGHTRPFQRERDASNDNNKDMEDMDEDMDEVSDEEEQDEDKGVVTFNFSTVLEGSTPSEASPFSESYGIHVRLATDDYPELEEIFDSWEGISTDTNASGVMEYIEEVYKSSRGQDLGTFGGDLLGTLFKEQSKKWERITLEYMSVIIYHVHRFTSEMVKSVCPDPRVYEELWNGYLLEELMNSYRSAMDRARFLLEIEREGSPLTLNPWFTNKLQENQGDRLVEQITKLGVREPPSRSKLTSNYLYIDPARLRNLSTNKANSAHVREYMHDILSSYYELARERFVDVVYQQAVNHCLLFGKGSPLKIFNTEMVLGLNEDQLDMIAAEDAPVKQRREKLYRDIKNFEEALKVLKGTR